MPGNGGSTKLLLHCDGTDGATTTTDASPIGHSVTLASGAQIDTAQSQFGSASLLLDGTNDNARVATGENDDYSAGFTLDFWMRPNSPGSSAFRRCAMWGNDDDLHSLHIGSVSNTGLSLEVGFLSDPVLVATVANTTWQHVAVTYDNTTLRLFVGGTLADSVAVSLGLNDCSDGWTFGGRLNGDLSVNNCWPGHLDEIRAVNEAIWTANFTPPAAAYDNRPMIMQRTYRQLRVA